MTLSIWRKKELPDQSEGSKNTKLDNEVKNQVKRGDQKRQDHIRFDNYGIFTITYSL